MGQFEQQEISNMQDSKIAIVVARFNSEITSKLLEGAQSELQNHGVKTENIETIYVPGAFELALTAKACAEKEFDAVICLGAVIRGGTPHFEYVANTCSLAISNVSLNTGVPCIFGVLTVDSNEQALDRVGGKECHKGEEAALSALEMVSVLRELKTEKSKKLTGFVS